MALGQWSSLSRALTAVICVVVCLVGFNIDLIGLLLLGIILNESMVAREYVVTGGMLWRLYYFGHHLVLATQNHGAIDHGASCAVCIKFDPIFDGCLPHDIQRLRCNATHRHCIIKIVSSAVTAFLIVLLLTMVASNRLPRQRNQIRMVHTTNVRPYTLSLLFLSH